MSAPTRRGLLGGAAVLVVAPVIAARGAAAPDTELSAIGRAAVPLIAEFDRSLAMFFALEFDSPDLEDVAKLADAPSAALNVMVDRASELQATSWDGFVAKARLLRHEMLTEFGNQGVFDTNTADPRDMLAWTLVNDMLAAGVAA